MAYQAALIKAWKEIENIGKRHIEIALLGDSYGFDTDRKTVMSVSCNVPAKEYVAILTLHYVIKCYTGLPKLTGEWISFKELSGGQGYYPAFKKRVIDTISRKYGANPDNLYKLIERFKAKRAQIADVSVVLDTFEESVPVLITFWRGDDEFGPEANMLFDKSVESIFCTEDIVVLSEIVAHSI